MGKLIVLFGPSTSGKSTIATSLGVERIPTVTSRKPRENEEDKVDYYFKTKKEFAGMIKNRELAEYSQYANNFYGCLKSSLEETFIGDSTKVVVMDIKGVKYLKDNHADKDIKYLYIGAYLDSIERRLSQRNLSEEEVKNRLIRAETQELTHKYRQYADEIIWNNDNMDIENVIKHIKKLMISWNY